MSKCRIELLPECINGYGEISPKRPEKGLILRLMQCETFPIGDEPGEIDAQYLQIASDPRFDDGCWVLRVGGFLLIFEPNGRWQPDPAIASLIGTTVYQIGEVGQVTFLDGSASE